MHNNGEITENQEYKEPDYRNPDFIMQNLDVCHVDRLYNEPPFFVRCRERLASLIAEQVSFYVMCLLKAYVACDTLPGILIVGSGYIGSAIIDSLDKCGCKPYLHIYCRSDSSANIWVSRGFKSDNDVARLMKGYALDIMIFAFNLASFPSVCRVLANTVTSQTACINCVFGLQRNRIMQLLSIHHVFRTYITIKSITSRIEFECRDFIVKRPKTKNSRSRVQSMANSDEVSEHSKPDDTHSVKGDDHSELMSTSSKSHASSHQKPLSEKDYSDSDSDSGTDFDMPVLNMGDFNFNVSVPEEAAMMIGERHDRIVSDLIFLLENFFSVRGMPYDLCRREAIESIVGSSITGDECYFNKPAPPLTNLQAVQSALNIAAAKHLMMQSNDKDRKGTANMRRRLPTHVRAFQPPVRPSAILSVPTTLTDAIMMLVTHCGTAFQRILSSHIRIADIPPPIILPPGEPPLMWPPESVYFDFVLDAFACRRRVHVPMHYDSDLTEIYLRDKSGLNPESIGFELIRLMDEDDDNERRLALIALHKDKAVGDPPEAARIYNSIKFSNIKGLSRRADEKKDKEPASSRHRTPSGVNEYDLDALHQQLNSARDVSVPNSARSQNTFRSGFLNR